jgi:hypothetical protein
MHHGVSAFRRPYSFDSLRHELVHRKGAHVRQRRHVRRELPIGLHGGDAENGGEFRLVRRGVPRIRVQPFAQQDLRPHGRNLRCGRSRFRSRLHRQGGGAEESGGERCGRHPDEVLHHSCLDRGRSLHQLPLRKNRPVPLRLRDLRRRLFRYGLHRGDSPPHLQYREAGAVLLEKRRPSHLQEFRRRRARQCRHSR